MPAILRSAASRISSCMIRWYSSAPAAKRANRCVALPSSSSSSYGHGVAGPASTRRRRTWGGRRRTNEDGRARDWSAALLVQREVGGIDKSEHPAVTEIDQSAIKSV
eukprot:5724359-Pleurochrysis_carterae.AAC.3